MDFPNRNRSRVFHAGAGGGKSSVFIRTALIFIGIFGLLCNTGNLSADQFGVFRRGKGDVYSNSPENVPVPIRSGLPSPSVASPQIAQPAEKVGSQVVVSSPSGTRTLIASQEKPLPNVVRLVAFEKDGRSFGSGSYIGNYEQYGLILSNWHVVCESSGLVHIHFPDGFSSFGVIVQSDKKWDLALIAISRPPNAITPLQISKTVPKPGDPLWIAGHGPGTFRLAGGNCVRYLAPEKPKNGSTREFEMIDLSVGARQGDSGGPILNRDGELAGVLFGSDMVQNTAGSHCQRVTRFLNQARIDLEKLPIRPEAYFANVEPNGPRHELSETVHSVPVEAVASTPAPRRRVDFGGSSSFGVGSPSRRYTQPVRAPAVPESNVPPPFMEFGAPGNVSEKGTSAPGTNPTTSRYPATDSNRDVQTAQWTRADEVRSVSTKWDSRPRINSSTNSSGKRIVLARHNAETGGQGSDVVPGIPDPFDNDWERLNPKSRGENSVRSDLPPLVSENGLQWATPAEQYGRRNETPSKPARGLTTVSERNESIHPILSIVVFSIVAALVFFSIRLLRTETRSRPADSSITSFAGRETHPA